MISRPRKSSAKYVDNQKVTEKKSKADKADEHDGNRDTGTETKTVFGKKENKCLCCAWLANERRERTNKSGDTQTLFFVYAFA